MYERMLAAALEARCAQEGAYPPSLHALTVGGKYINFVPGCPTNSRPYAYTVSRKGDEYTLACRGAHHREMPEVAKGFPQYHSSAGILQWNHHH